MEAARPVGRFPREQRIRRRSEFQAIQSRSQRVVLPHFVLLLRFSLTGAAVSGADSAAALQDAGTSDSADVSACLAASRLGVTASRKIGSAVIRNRAKRLVREAFRATRSLWPPHSDIVVIVRKFEPDWRLNDVVTEWRRNESFIRRGFQLYAARRTGETGP